MVWHAYTLNPRDFLEDCMRSGKMPFWRAGLPLAAINACINNESFEFTASPQARNDFESKTGLAWDSLFDAPEHVLPCPQCRATVTCLWTDLTNDRPWNGNHPGEHGSGFTDKNFVAKCPSCGLYVNHDVLRAQKFRKDVGQLMSHDTPMPGTILSIDGMFSTVLVLYLVLH